MSMKKLTPTEIKETVEKIRRKYDEYSFKFFKPARHKSNFEDRYVDALKSGVDISSFLLAEISAITELVKREEDRILEKKPPKPQAPAEPGFVDRILEENLKRIARYPELEIHPDASEEVRRLYGALHALEQDFWPRLYAILRNTAYSLNTKTMIGLETQLHGLGGHGKDGVAARLERYRARLGRFPRDYLLIEKEAKDYILESSFFLHELEEILESAGKKHEAAFSASEKKALAEVHDYLSRVIADFRLKDLKRRS